MSELIQSSIYLTRHQKNFLKNNFINLSSMTRARINDLIENREGQVVHAKPSKIPIEDFSNVT